MPTPIRIVKEIDRVKEIDHVKEIHRDTNFCPEAVSTQVPLHSVHFEDFLMPYE